MMLTETRKTHFLVETTDWFRLHCVLTDKLVIAAVGLLVTRIAVKLGVRK